MIFFLSPQDWTCSVAVPGTSRNNNSENREPTGDRSLNDPYPEVMFSACHTCNLNDSDQEETHHTMRKLSFRKTISSVAKNKFQALDHSPGDGNSRFLSWIITLGYQRRVFVKCDWGSPYILEELDGHQIYPLSFILDSFRSTCFHSQPNQFRQLNAFSSKLKIEVTRT